MKHSLITIALGTLCACITAVSFSANAATVSFDDDGGDQGGTLFYAGTDGTLFGKDIDFYSITGVGTLNDSEIACVGCTLNFTTGPNTQEGPSEWLFGGASGSLTITGSIPAIGINLSTTLVKGSFDSAELDLAAGLLIMIGFGTDEKHEKILNYFGLQQGFDFAETSISTQGVILDPANACAAAGIINTSRCDDGAFFADVTEADFANVGTVVPVPAAVWLFGSGLLGLVGIARRKAV